MKYATYQLPGDAMETARVVLFAEIFSRVDSCDSAERVIRICLLGSDVIMIGDIDRDQFKLIPGETLIIP